MKKKSIDGYYLEVEGEDMPKEIEEIEEKFELPSEKKPLRKDDLRRVANKIGKKHPKKKSKKLKWIIILSIAGLIYLFYDQIILFLLSILKKNPTAYKYYLFLESQIVNYTLYGLLLMSILGSLFFLMLPSEALFIYFLNTTQHFPLVIMAIMIMGNLIGMTVNYLIGWTLGERVIRFFFKDNFESYKTKVKKYGGVVLFFGNIFPGPIEVLSLFYGGFKFNMTRYIFLVFMGRLIKYTILFLAFVFFWDQIIGYYDGFLSYFGSIV